MRKIILFVFAMIISGTAQAGGIDKSAFLTDWGGGSIKKCLGDSIHGTTACIGASAANECNPLDSSGKNRATLMMVAREINKGYAVFCPTQLDAELLEKKKDKNNKRGTVWTIYRTPTGYGETLCVKLFNDNYEGRTNNNNTAGGCDSDVFFRDTYSGIGISGSDVGNIEKNIPMFTNSNNKDECSGNKGHREHDIVLAIVEWTPGGHGAFVQPVQVSAARTSLTNDNVKAWVNLAPVNGSTRKLACKHGYQANVNKTNCEPIDSTKCATSEEDKLASLCPIQNKDTYDTVRYTLQYNEADRCYIFTCSNPNYGFANAGSLDCVKCTGSARQGISPTTGECIKCPTGKIFSKGAGATSGYCAETETYSREQLLYGPSKSPAPELDAQCWTKSGDDYVNCVLGK